MFSLSNRYREEFYRFSIVKCQRERFDLERVREIFENAIEGDGPVCYGEEVVCQPAGPRGRRQRLG